MFIDRSPALIRFLLFVSGLALAVVVGTTVAGAQSSEPVSSGGLKVSSPSDGSAASKADEGTVGRSETVELEGSGYVPGADVDVMIESTPRLLATVKADATGSFKISVAIPADMEVGAHTLKAIGPDPTGGIRVLSMPVTVAETIGGLPSQDGDLARGGLATTGSGTTIPLAAVGVVAIGLGSAVLMGLAIRRRTTTAA